MTLRLICALFVASTAYASSLRATVGANSVNDFSTNIADASSLSLERVKPTEQLRSHLRQLDASGASCDDGQGDLLWFHHPNQAHPPRGTGCTCDECCNHFLVTHPEYCSDCLTTMKCI